MEVKNDFSEITTETQKLIGLLSMQILDKDLKIKALEKELNSIKNNQVQKNTPGGN